MNKTSESVDVYFLIKEFSQKEKNKGITSKRLHKLTGIGIWSVARRCKRLWEKGIICRRQIVGQSRGYEYCIKKSERTRVVSKKCGSFVELVCVDGRGWEFSLKKSERKVLAKRLGIDLKKRHGVSGWTDLFDNFHGGVSLE